MWVRKRIDIRWSDLAVGLWKSVFPTRRESAEKQLAQVWSDDDDVLACLSVRSGFDLLLQTLDLPPGGEVIMTSVTIPDMPKIVEEHQLKPVPIDLNIMRMDPDLDQLRASITDQTKVIVVAHLFGGKVDLEPIAEIAREHNLLLIEDCAQAFVGIHDTGHSGADVSMFSFGPIKTNTALCGALFRVRRPELLRRMRAIHESWPTQTRGTFARRLFKYAFVQVISLRWIAGSVAGALRLIGKDHDGIATSMARGFAGGNFFTRIRKQPSTPLLEILHRRLKRFDPDTITMRVERGEFLNKLFHEAIPIPGSQAVDPTYWVYPIVVDEPEKLVRKLWTYGYDATWHSSLIVIQPDPDSNHKPATHAERVLAQTVYLPFSRKMSKKTLRHMAELVLAENPVTHFKVQATQSSVPAPTQVTKSRRVAHEAT